MRMVSRRKAGTVGQLIALVITASLASSCTQGESSSPTTKRQVTSATPTPSSPDKTLHRNREPRITIETAGELYDPSFGVVEFWVCRGRDSRCHARLFIKSRAQQWREITPSAIPTGSSLHDSFFLDRDHGWSLVGNCATATSSLYRTTDGGRTWARSNPKVSTSCHAGSVFSVDFADPVHGTVTKSNSVGQFAYFFRTFDGGDTWGKEIDLPVAADVRFIDEFRGWTGEAFWPGPKTYSSVDGGKTWTPRRIALSADFRGRQPRYGLPTFFDESMGVLPVTFLRHRKADAAFFSTSDGGQTFSLASSVKANAAIGRPATSIVSPTTWWALFPTEPPSIFLTTNGGQNWKRITPVGLSSSGELSAVSDKQAWTSTSDGLYETADGGTTWRRMRPPASLRRSVRN